MFAVYGLFVLLSHIEYLLPSSLAAMDYGSEGRKARGPQIPPALNIQGSLTIRSRQIKVRFLETSKEQEKRANSDLVYDSLFQDMEIICLTPQERDFPSLSRRRIGARNNVGPSYSEVAKKKKN